MKAEHYALVNGQVRKNAINRLMDLPVDGTVQVTIAPAATKSARQRGLQHLWYNDIVRSGIGGAHEADEESLDQACKYRWGLPIMIRDEPMFAELFLGYSKKFKADPKRMRWFVKQNVHTEKFTQSQMAEYLTAIRDYYGIDLGVNLTDPDSKGWGNLLEVAHET